ncbi:Pup--protein ligase [Nitrospira sp. KM1]|uniref:proteasome accessory factor PafA2 family protein n=1 Tax=Nitrospira sp. KM1 TaxID=1936990 RepID=UPI0013A71B54|nr:proteasome accessory factor PafA2 family protein [Nitrospira sp. KM1]BCA56092.1 Pup--protein ligase [Nitrospira sp. KM1]
MLNRIFGLETEYGLLVHQDRPEHSPTWFAHKLRDHIFHVQRQGVLDLHHRGHDEPPGNGGFITNAGRIYLDMGHLEYASPECQSLTDVVATDRAGDAIIQQAIDDLDLGEQVSLIKNNVDHETDATFGSHENYLVSRRFPFTRRGLAPLVTFLVTRQIFTGSGRVGAANPQDAWIQMDRLIVPRGAMGHRPDIIRLPFQISQRADHIVNDFFEWVQQNRAIVNTRDEPLADPNQYRRIHLLLGDSNMAEYATALKMGTTGLVLQLIEDGKAPRDIELDEPVETLQEISQDQERRWLVRLMSGTTISAIDVQERFLEAAKAHCMGQDEETDWVLQQWEVVLQDLRGSYDRLVGRIDWASKLWLLESFREAEQLEWNDPMLKSLDLEYHNLNPGKGLYYGLLEEGRVPRLTTDKAIALAMNHPPRNTRAFGRGELVRHLVACGPPAEPEDSKVEERFFPSYVINWSIFQLRGQAPFPMADPFKTYAQEVRSHLSIA